MRAVTSRTFADVGNGYGDQSDDNERDGEVKKFTENSVERNEYSHQRSRKNSANGNPQDDSNNDAWQQADLDFLHSDSFLVFCFPSQIKNQAIATTTHPIPMQ